MGILCGVIRLKSMLSLLPRGGMQKVITDKAKADADEAETTN